jgi:hypothetical protein
MRLVEPPNQTVHSKEKLSFTFFKKNFPNTSLETKTLNSQENKKLKRAEKAM